MISTCKKLGLLCEPDFAENYSGEDSKELKLVSLANSTNKQQSDRILNSTAISAQVGFWTHWKFCIKLLSKWHTVFPQIRPAGIIFLQGLQLRVLLECGYYSRAGIIIRCSSLLWISWFSA